MKACQAILAVLLTMTASSVSLASSPQMASADRKMGTLTIVVPVSDDEPRPFQLVISKSGTIRELTTNAEGNITTQLPAGSYTAYVKPPSGTLDRRVKLAPFLVEAGGEVTIHLDPMLGSVYCSSDGTRVIPVRSTDSSINNLKDLHKPKYESIYLNHNKSVVIEDRERNQTTQYTEYKSSVVTYDAFRLESDKAIYNEQLKTIESLGRVFAVQHGQIEERPRVTLSFDGGRAILNLTGGAIPMIKGDGSIKSGAGTATFDFRLDRFGIVKFEYEDRGKGLKLQSRKHDCLVLAKVSKDGDITFSGTAVATGTDNSVVEEKIVNFTVTLRDHGSKHKRDDRFSILIPTLNYNASDRITSGDIKVSELPKKDQPVARVIP